MDLEAPYVTIVRTVPKRAYTILSLIGFAICESCIAPDLFLVYIAQNVLSSLLVIYIVRAPFFIHFVGGIYHATSSPPPPFEQTEKSPRL